MPLSASMGTIFLGGKSRNSGEFAYFRTKARSNSLSLLEGVLITKLRRSGSSMELRQRCKVLRQKSKISHILLSLAPLCSASSIQPIICFFLDSEVKFPRPHLPRVPPLFFGEQLMRQLLPKLFPYGVILF